MPPWPRFAISAYPQARCLWTSSNWILSAAFVKRSKSTRLRPPLWSSEDQEKKFGTFTKDRSRLAWFRARRALRASPNGQNFRYETGQETPITLVRAIQEVGLENQGVNFDLANLILYGKANPVDAIELLGSYVQGIHAKDGMWPTNPRDLGKEVPIGKGKVDFPRIIERLKQLNYRGAVTIEREISGPQQVADVRDAKTYLENLIG